MRGLLTSRVGRSATIQIGRLGRPVQDVAKNWRGPFSSLPFHQGDELGTVEKRKLADLVVLDGDPLDDIRNTRRIVAVYKGGEPAAV